MGLEMQDINSPMKKNCGRYVQDQQLQQKQVHFRGYVQDIEDKIHDADVSVVTSNTRRLLDWNFGQSKCKVPVVAYDIKYGPSAMIEHDRSGMLVQEGDIAALAAAIEKCFFQRQKCVFMPCTQPLIMQWMSTQKSG